MAFASPSFLLLLNYFVEIFIDKNVDSHAVVINNKDMSSRIFLILLRALVRFPRGGKKIFFNNFKRLSLKKKKREREKDFTSTQKLEEVRN